MLVALSMGCGSQVVQFPEDVVDSGIYIKVDDCSRDSNQSDSIVDVRDSADVKSEVDAFETDVSDTLEADVTDTLRVDVPDILETDVSDTPGCISLPGAVVNLGTAGDFAVLAKSGISTVPASAITGDIGVSPIAATGITGFSLIMDSSNTFSTSTQVTGKVYAADYTPPTPSKMTTAIGDMETAFIDAASRAPTVTELGAGNISGMTLPPGVYKWSTGLLISTNVTLLGNCGDVWVFEIAKDLTISSGTSIIMAGGALPKNVFWQVSGATIIKAGAHCEGNVLTQTAVSLATGASVNGRLLAQTAVTLDHSTVVKP